MLTNRTCTMCKLSSNTEKLFTHLLPVFPDIPGSFFTNPPQWKSMDSVTFTERIFSLQFLTFLCICKYYGSLYFNSFTLLVYFHSQGWYYWQLYWHIIRHRSFSTRSMYNRSIYSVLFLTMNWYFVKKFSPIEH